jgi:hypothetical protein
MIWLEEGGWKKRDLYFSSVHKKRGVKYLVNKIKFLKKPKISLDGIYKIDKIVSMLDIYLTRFIGK